MKKLIRFIIFALIVGLLVFTFRAEIGEFVESKIGKDNLEKVEDGTRKGVQVIKQGAEKVAEKGKETLDSLKNEE